ncbi:hypothetical protein [Emticicia agri]|uniref:VWA domain-containing protein n=1 Tax=Emticicia agri TaxID=2492393 RepID=A0A4Q5M2B2_9BACT|nr:hypothetical protein [Emticicia agri]RYU96235.1 hypothetical protein EWM59_08480 [Emticicia agri]
MSEEEKFHRIIREKLNHFQPEHSPDDWNKMKRKIMIDNLLRFSIPSAVVLILGLSYYWFAGSDPLPIKSEVIAQKITPTEIKPKQEESIDDKTFTKIELPKEKKSVPAPVVVKTTTPTEPLKPAESAETTPLTNFKVNKLASRKVAAPAEKHTDLVDTEIRFLNSSAVSMSDKIMRVRELGKTYELTSYEALDRNADKWKNIVIVCDMTSSMFPYTTQVFDWMMENVDNNSIKGIIFFTDCDSLGNETRGKLPGKMFMVKKKDELLLWDTMFAAISNTENNKNKAENNIEALLFAQKNFPEIDDIVMIADNSSPVKDMRNLSKLKKKTHIILCGETYEKNLAFQSDYVQIAKKTDGSIHTLEDDIVNPANIKEMTVIRVGKIYFRFQKGKFYTTKMIFRP